MCDYKFHWSIEFKSKLLMHSKWFNCINLHMRMTEYARIVQLVGCAPKKYILSESLYWFFMFLRPVTPSHLWRWDNSADILTSCLQLRNQHSFPGKGMKFLILKYADQRWPNFCAQRPNQEGNKMVAGHRASLKIIPLINSANIGAEELIWNYFLKNLN